jgi:hypothetical protein
VKRVAERAGLNCGRCVTEHGNKCAEGPYCMNFFLHKFRHYAVFRTMPNVICAMVAHASESAGSPFSGSAVFGIVRHASQALEEAKQLIVRSVRSSPSFDGGSLRKHLLFQGEVGVEVDLGCFD